MRLAPPRLGFAVGAAGVVALAVAPGPFGVGPVLRVAPLAGAAPVVVRFHLGQKTLRAKFAKLQPA